MKEPTQNAVTPVWSPSGDHSAFGLGARNTAGIESHIVTARDGSALRKLTSSSRGNYGFPSWLADRRRLVYRATEGNKKGLIIIDLESGVTKLSRPVSGTTTFLPGRPKVLIVYKRSELRLEPPYSSRGW